MSLQDERLLPGTTGLGRDLRPPASDVIAYRRMRQVTCVVLRDQLRQDPPHRVPLHTWCTQIGAQHRIDRRLERLQPRRGPFRRLARRRRSGRVDRRVHSAPMNPVPLCESTNRDASPMIVANCLEQLHERNGPPRAAFRLQPVDRYTHPFGGARSDRHAVTPSGTGATGNRPSAATQDRQNQSDRYSYVLICLSNVVVEQSS